MRQVGEQSLDIVIFNGSPRRIVHCAPSFRAPRRAHAPSPARRQASRGVFASRARPGLLGSGLPTNARSAESLRADRRFPVRATRPNSRSGSRESGAARQLPDGRHFAEELAQRPGRRAAPSLAGGNVAHDAGFGGDLRAGADLEMARQPRLTAEGGEVADHGRAGNARLRDENAVAADDDIVADLHEIIDLRPLADDRVAIGAAIDRRAGADLDVVLDDHAADLRHLEMPARPHREAEAVLTDVRAGMDDHAIADEGAGDRSERADDAVAPDAHLRADHGVRADHRPGADLRARDRSPRRGRRSRPASSRAAEWTKAAGETPVSPNVERGLTASG